MCLITLYSSSPFFWYNNPFEQTKQKIRLIDYELMANEQKQRLVLFGKHAGYAGMIDGVHGLGQRLLGLGFSSPFLASISSLSLVVIGNDITMAFSSFVSNIPFLSFS